MVDEVLKEGGGREVVKEIARDKGGGRVGRNE